VLSLNVPVPGSIRGHVDSLRPLLDEDRRDHTLVLKRLGGESHPARTRKRVRRLLRGQPPFAVELAGVGCFEAPARGETPVVYLAVESAALVRLHEDLCEIVDPVPGLEGSAYVPHITIGRATAPDVIERVTARAPEPETWTVSELVFWDARHEEVAGRVSLPA
jgi:hypothetical protein